MSESDWTIRPFERFDEYRACVDLQDRTWGSGFSERVPVAILKAANRIGGIAAGAFEPDGTLVGFVFGISGVEEGRIIHWSDMLAVRPSHRNRGLGFALKAFQRRHLLQLGVDRVYWTFDPLQAKNAFFNVERLGAVGVEYVVEMYGETGSPLHHGIGSDRVIMCWRLATERVDGLMSRSGGSTGTAASRSDATEPQPLFPVEVGEFGPAPRLEGGAPELHRDSSEFALPIPVDIDRLTAHAPEIAERWRRVTRPVLVDAMGRGFRLCRVTRHDTFVALHLERP